MAHSVAPILLAWGRKGVGRRPNRNTAAHTGNASAMGGHTNPVSNFGTAQTPAIKTAETSSHWNAHFAKLTSGLGGSQYVAVMIIENARTIAGASGSQPCVAEKRPSSRNTAIVKKFLVVTPTCPCLRRSQRLFLASSKGLQNKQYCYGPK